MEFIKNFPLFNIILCFVAVVICSLLKRKAARIVTIIVEMITIAVGVCVLVLTLNKGTIIYQMGHFAAPFCNEIRFGVLEGVLVTFFPLIILLSLLGGIKHLERDIDSSKEKYFYVLMNLVLVAIISLIYTNDVFTGYVFLEISTLSSIGLIFIKNKGNTIVAAIRYMIFNLMGSGMFLLGITFLYGLTGFLSMSFIQTEITKLIVANKNIPAIICSFLLITVGLGIKSGLFPFYYWMPDAYGESTTTSSAIVSGVISKGYIILILKIIYRTFGIENYNNSSIRYVLFILGFLGMIFGSISAIAQKKISRMVSFSSAAQIGYIFLGMGLGSAGMCGAVFQILAHAAAKPLLFVSTSRLIDASDGKESFKDLRCAGKKHRMAGFGYFVGALSMVGIPFFAGFVTKYLLTTGSLQVNVPTFQTVLVIIALVISTLLNTIYFLRTLITIFYPLEDYNTRYNNDNSEDIKPIKHKDEKLFNVSIIGFSLLVILLGSIPYIINLLNEGLSSLA